MSRAKVNPTWKHFDKYNVEKCVATPSHICVVFMYLRMSRAALIPKSTNVDKYNVEGPVTTPPHIVSFSPSAACMHRGDQVKLTVKFTAQSEKKIEWFHNRKSLHTGIGSLRTLSFIELCTLYIHMCLSIVLVFDNKDFNKCFMSNQSVNTAKNKIIEN